MRVITNPHKFQLCIPSSGVAITFAALATLGAPAVQGGLVPPVLGHFVERNSMGSKILMYKSLKFHLLTVAKGEY